MIQEQSSSHHHQHQLPKYGTGSVTGVARASKKIPQRGLGVAQLEKLRLEEQKKMEGSGGGTVQENASTSDGTVSTGLSLTASSSHPTEPPSNQMYSSRSSAAPAPPEENRESAGLDRPWPFMFEGMTTAPAFRTSTGKATPTVPCAARTVKRDAGFADVCPDLMSRHEFRATNYFSSARANYSDRSPDFAYCKNSEANGCAGEPAFLSLSAQPANLTKQHHAMPPSAHLPEYSDLGVLQSQGSIAASRPFYSFLPAGPVRCERPLSECMADVPEGVDLELKL